MESIETVSQRKEQYINTNKYVEGEKKRIVWGWDGYVSLLRWARRLNLSMNFSMWIWQGLKGASGAIKHNTRV